MTNPTPRQRQILWTIYQHQLAHGVPPTMRELMAVFGMSSPNGVMAHLTALERKGYLTMTEMRSRGIRLTGVSWLPVFDDSPAGLYFAEMGECPECPETIEEDVA